MKDFFLTCMMHLRTRHRQRLKRFPLHWRLWSDVTEHLLYHFLSSRTTVSLPLLPSCILQSGRRMRRPTGSTLFTHLLGGGAHCRPWCGSATNRHSGAALRPQQKPSCTTPPMHLKTSYPLLVSLRSSTVQIPHAVFIPAQCNLGTSQFVTMLLPPRSNNHREAGLNLCRQDFCASNLTPPSTWWWPWNRLKDPRATL